jgi:hypothetical protein
MCLQIRAFALRNIEFITHLIMHRNNYRARNNLPHVLFSSSENLRFQAAATGEIKHKNNLHCGEWKCVSADH